MDLIIVPAEILIGGADLFLESSPWVHHVKGVKVIVEPSHGILNGHMQVPEGVILRNVDSAPDGWPDVF
ncbi:hypothetical protein ES703_116690 [subsurface metagenome]